MSEPEHSLPPFNWNEVTVEGIHDTCGHLITQTELLFDQLVQLGERQLSFATCIAPLMSPPNYKTNPLLCETKFLQHCSTDPEIRKAAKEAATKFTKARVAGRMREDIYKKITEFSQLPAAKGLTEYQKHFLDSILLDFKRSGFTLEQGQRDNLVKLLERDSELCAQYSENISNDKTVIIFTKEELEGVPQDFIDSRLNSEGKVQITLKYPDILPILQHCHVQSSRKKVKLISNSVYGNNLELIAEGTQLRKQIASILGYASYADFITERRMAGNAKTVIEFLDSLQAKVKHTGEKEIERLLELKRKHLEQRGEEFDGKINAWDSSFYTEQLLQKEYGVDDNVIKEYFPLSVVVEGTLQIYQELLSLRFVEIHQFERWHDSVRLFVVYDETEGENNGKLIGHFYLDLHPREGKYTHAAIFHILKRHNDQAPVDCMLTNLPEGTRDAPSLLSHDDVVTFFHEFGHIMHGLCAEGEANNTRLAKCPRDFVEAPSQMLENWCWQPEVLAKLSKHYHTGEPLPENLLKNLIAAKNVNIGMNTLRQIFLAKLDMTIHTEAPQDLQTLVDVLSKEITLIENPEGCNILRSFGHLMGQYKAGYYGYLWSEVLSSDMFFTRFAKDGIFNKQTGMDYRKTVLAPGGVGSIMAHLTKFLGRPPQQEHFLQSRGILS